MKNDRQFIYIICLVFLFIYCFTVLAGKREIDRELININNTRQLKYLVLKDSLNSIIADKEIENKILYNYIDSLTIKRTEKNAKLIEQIDSIRNISDAIKFNLWKERYFNN